MAIKITHPAIFDVRITFDNYFDYIIKDTLDNITETACDIMVKHNCHLAVVHDNAQTRTLIKIKRS